MTPISTSLFVFVGLVGRCSDARWGSGAGSGTINESDLGVYELIGHSTCLSGEGDHVQWIQKQTGSDLECRKLCDEAKYCSGYHWKVDDRWNPGYYPCWMYNGVAVGQVDPEPSGGKCWKKAAFEYSMGVKGDTDCPSWSEHIKDFEECRKAAVALKVDNNGPDGPGLWYETPTWCSFRRMNGGSLQGKNAAFFNRRAVGKNYGEYTAICKRIPLEERQSPKCPEHPRSSGTCETIGMRCDYGDECCCGDCDGTVSPLVSTCAADGNWHKPPSLCKIGMCNPAPVPTPAPTPSPTPAPTPSPVPSPTAAKLGLNGRCYSKGASKAERDDACEGNLVCARKGHDGRNFGGCGSLFGRYYAGWPYRHHCCSRVPGADSGAKRRLDGEASKMDDIVKLSDLMTAEAFCVFAKERSICGMQCTEVNKEINEFLPEGLLDVCLGTDMAIRDLCGTECAASE